MSTIKVSDTVARKYGFESGDELREMMGEVLHLGMRDPATNEEFDKWLDADLTKKGLLKILEHAQQRKEMK